MSTPTPREYVNTRKTGPDEITVTIVDFKPDVPEAEVPQPLRLGLAARDNCGDGTNEYRHIDPLVTWQKFPVKYFIESSVVGTLHAGIVKSFEPFNSAAGFKMFERTMNTAEAKIRVGIAPIDAAGGTIARCQWTYSPTRKEITKATITFDSSEAWSELKNESCGRIGGIFDIIQVGVHENGHHCGLAHAPTDKLQTMYATTSPGITLGRTLGNGDLLGFKTAYKIKDEPPPPPPPTNQAPIAKNITIKTHYKHFLIALQGSDPDGDLPLLYRTEQPANGTIVPYRKVEYKTNMTEGTDSFMYTVTDSKGQESAPAKVTLHILKD